MIYRELQKAIPPALWGLDESAQNELELTAVHFTNKTLLHIRFNGEMDATYEVQPRGAGGLAADVGGLHGGAASSLRAEGNDEDEFVEDHLSKYNVSMKMGNSNDMKLPVVVMQIAELYERAVYPSVLGAEARAGPDLGLLVTLSSRFWRSASAGGPGSGSDFDRLMFVLQSIREMYGI
ncbi:AAL155Wp [Eremothecium gossypii ATCC 10895]|uniref:AAL155Wp n=1 Tax=Eremothecium gossypii (strain ATCC 10895 / CBS 109.51 / FGSC 9923 / NRRL Y-1056) TaxID=284811 RepID=Q75F97_EREGS|nr:AAL155Wp [Eremothecium gossypii ATCC 10895]AAS50211.1 AAL155Wp [Eremothecium gossypii ATCC 10895]AEY94496.1 FAAL155Wp [Eremothecium gossypii FDAG1]